MTTIQVSETAAQSPSVTTQAVTDFNDAIRDAHTALNGPLDAIAHLEEASRLAAEIKNPHAQELASLADALQSAFETLKLVEMCLLDSLPER